jgi:signal transduction histidine kinase
LPHLRLGRRALADRAKEKGLALRTRIDPDADVRVMADPLRLGQILTNLVSNAAKFPDRGEMTLAARRVGARPRLEVTDTYGAA